MRNLKKLLAVVVAICVLATFTIPAFAADTETTKTDAQIVTTLGVLKGQSVSEGVTDAYLATTPNRLQGAIMFLRLKGLEEDALAFTGTDNFADVPATYAADSKAILAYLKAHPELGFEGTGGDNFSPAEQMTAQQYYKILLVALGFTYGTDETADFTWDTIFTFGAAHGLTKLVDNTSFTVNDLATGTVEALKATVKDGSGTLAAKLAEADEDFAAKAEALGLYTPAPATLEVVSVTADNLKEIVVTFNTALDKDTATDVDNYQVEDEALASDLGDDKAVGGEGDDADTDPSIALNADGKSVTITLGVPFESADNQTEKDLTVSGVKSAAGVEIEETTIHFVLDDVKTPVPQKITLTGPHTFEIEFSEPIKDVGTISIEDDEYTGEPTVNGTKTATVEIGDSSLDEGNYKVVVKGFADFAGLKSLSKTFTLAYAKDTTAPTAKVVEATQSKVVIEFNKPVYAGDPDESQSLTKDYFYHSLSSNHPDDGVTVDGNKKFTLKWGENNALPEGNVKVVVLASDDDAAVTDGWGNELEDNLVFTVAITADNTKPEVTKIEVKDQKNIKVYFSEDVKKEQARDVGNYVLTDKDGDEVYINDAEYSDKDYYATLTVSDDLNGAYKLKISGIEDKALDANKILAVTKSFTVADVTAPKLTLATVEARTVGTANLKNQVIYVYFPENMATSGTYSVLDKEKYQITNGDKTVDLDSGDTVKTFEGTDKIKITIKDGKDYFGSGIDLDVTELLTPSDPANTLIVTGKFADAAGNKAAPVQLSLALKEDVPPDITGVKVLDEKTLEITVNGKLVKSPNASGFLVQKGTGAVNSLSSIKKVEYKDGNTIVTGVLKGTEQIKVYDDGSDFKAYTVSVAADKVKTLTGLYMKAPGTFAGTVADGFAPTLKDTAKKSIVKGAAPNTIEIKFTEALDDTITSAGDLTKLVANDLVITKNGDSLKAGVDFYTDISGDTIIVTFVKSLSTDTLKKDRINIKSVSEPKFIADKSGNEAEAFTETVQLIWPN